MKLRNRISLFDFGNQRKDSILKPRKVSCAQTEALNDRTYQRTKQRPKLFKEGNREPIWPGADLELEEGTTASISSSVSTKESRIN